MDRKEKERHVIVALRATAKALNNLADAIDLPAGTRPLEVTSEVLHKTAEKPPAPSEEDMANALTDNSPMPFGKYKGNKMKTLTAGYLDWLHGQEWIKEWPHVLAYIMKNRKVIDQELKDQDYEKEV